MNIFENIRTIIIEAAKSFGINDKKILDKITAEPPKEEIHGDISTNIALLSSKALNKNPRELAENIGMLLKKNNYIEKNK